MTLITLLCLAASPTHDLVMSRAPQRFTTHDRPTNAHETTHFLVGSSAGFDGATVHRLTDPGLTTAQVDAFVRARGYRHATYFPTAETRGHRSAFWIVGEASGYLAGAKTAEEDTNSGAFVPASDWVSGVAEFGHYLHAYADAYRFHQPAIFAADTAFHNFLASWTAEAKRVFLANAARFPLAEQGVLFQQWANK
ncbi:hypothetical protein GC170_14490 [bacterium]|nr:hypothetical protein [bacterium]